MTWLPYEVYRPRGMESVGVRNVFDLIFFSYILLLNDASNSRMVKVVTCPLTTFTFGPLLSFLHVRRYPILRLTQYGELKNDRPVSEATMV